MDSYSPPASQWRSTMEDSATPFTNVTPALIEQEQEELKKKAQEAGSTFELADKNVVLKFGKEERFT